jgi:CheY-like chemotaxis protein
MIVVVDEDVYLLSVFETYILAAGQTLRTFVTADQAFESLSVVEQQDIDLAVIDVMLAADGSARSAAGEPRFRRSMEQESTVGLDLLRQLATCNPAVFPARAALWTHYTQPDVVGKAEEAARSFEVPLWAREKGSPGAEVALLVLRHVAALRATIPRPNIPGSENNQ